MPAAREDQAEDQRVILAIIVSAAVFTAGILVCIVPALICITISDGRRAA